MSMMRYYTVVQEREIKVMTSDPDIAVLIATEAFDKNSSTGCNTEKGHPTSGIRNVAISAREDF